MCYVRKLQIHDRFTVFVNEFDLVSRACLLDPGCRSQITNNLQGLGTKAVASAAIGIAWAGLVFIENPQYVPFGTYMFLCGGAHPRDSSMAIETMHVLATFNSMPADSTDS
jgi:hypothetical protein